MDGPSLLPTDVLVLGSGPAGSTAAALLARQGFTVTILTGASASPTPWGQCLAPGVRPFLEQLGVGQAVVALPHTRAVVGLRFFSQSGDQRVDLRFAEALAPVAPEGLAVHRGELDQALRAKAKESGAEVLSGWRAVRPVWDGDRLAGVVAATPGGTTRTIHARAVLDATGQAAFLASRMGWRFGYVRRRKVAVQQWRRAVAPPTGEPLWLTYAAAAGGWAWALPLGDGAVAVAAVLDDSPATEPPPDVEGTLERLVTEDPVARQWGVTSPPMASEVRRGFSYRVLRVAGDGYCLLGDAGGFVDPTPPFGVLIAVATAFCAAEDVAEAFARHGRVDTADFGPTIALSRRLHRLSFSLARALHDPCFHPFLFHPPGRWQLRPALVSLLAGAVLREGWWRCNVRFRALRTLSWLSGVARQQRFGKPPAVPPPGGGAP